MAELEYNPLTGWGINPVEIAKHLLASTHSNSEREFVEAYSYLQASRYELSCLAMQYYKEAYGLEAPIPGVSLLGRRSWIPSRLIDLDLRKPNGLTLSREKKTPSRNELFHKESCYLPWSSNYVKNIQAVNQKIVQEIKPPKHLRPRLFNAPTYQLLDFGAMPEAFHFVCCRNKYYSYMNSCELLHFEFARAVWMQFIRHGKKPEDQKLRQLKVPLRKAVDVFSFGNRCVGIGISTLLIEKDGDQFQFLKHKRSSSAIIEAIDTEHVVPAGTFQPRREMPLSKDPDFDIYRNILREFGEELLGHKDMEEVKADTVDIIEDRRISGLHKLFVDGHAKAFFLGWGLDPLTTKAEFLTAVIVNVRKLRAGYRKFKFKDNWEGRHSPVPFNEEEIVDFVDGSFTQPAGAGCAKLAWENRDQLLNSVD